MGRYDKIKIYNGSSWVKPKQIKVYSGSNWLDLGLDDSSNTRSLYAYLNSVRSQRITLNRTVVNVPGESYATGAFQLLPTDMFSFYSARCDIIFRATIRKRAGGNKRIFYSGRGSNIEFSITWLDDGRLQIVMDSRGVSGGARKVFETTNAVGLNQWVYLDVYMAKNSMSLAVTFNGVTTYSSSVARWSVSGSTNYVGDSDIDFKNGFEAQFSGKSGSSATRYVYINMSSAAGTTSDYSGVNHVDTSTSRIEWR